MKFPFYWVDAFASKVFAGNPAGVVPLASWPADALMQRIAFENGLAETAFFVRTAETRYQLRWFTPTLEVDLCGHATLASAFVLMSELGFTGGTVTFDTRSGPLSVTRRAGRPAGATHEPPPEDARKYPPKDGPLLELDFPSRPAAPCAASPALVQALGAHPASVAQARDTLCVFARAEDVLALRPDFPALARLDTFGLIATAPGKDCDFVSRFFVPSAGINEDPVTGSAHSTLVPYWAQRLGKTKLHARQVSARGGELWCEQAGDRVKIAGHAVLYLKGEIRV